MNKKRVHWWKSGSEKDVADALRITLFGGEPAPGWYAFANYSRAAFCYEHEARTVQKQRKAKSPCYRFEKPFPELTQHQKELLKSEFPSLGWTLLPQERSTRTTPAAELSAPPPKGWIDIHFWVDPHKTDKRQVLEAIEHYFDSEKRAMGVVKEPNSGVRRKPYPWKSLEIVDAFLNGAPQEESDRCNAGNVLRRRY